MDELEKLYRQNKLKAAERLLQKKLTECPDDSYTLTQLATVMWNRGDNTEALRYADRAKAINPTDPFLIFMRGRILWSLQDYKSSIIEWDKMISMSETAAVDDGYGRRWTKAVVNDARFYKADCLYHLYRDKEALPIMTEHLRHRAKGIESDFSKKEAIQLYKVLKYSRRENANGISDIGYATEAQKTRIGRRIDSMEKNGDWYKMVKYLKVVSKHYPREYYLKTVLSEYCKIIGDKSSCMAYAEEAFEQEPHDPLVKYNYAVALWLSDMLADSLHQFEEIVALGIDYIAFSEHGEGTVWAKRIMRDTENNIAKIRQNIVAPA